MNLSELLQIEAVGRGLLEPEREIDAATAFTLVRDMPYKRASSREPETIIREWRGTCSGKHYLLKALFAELGLRARLMACTTELPLDTRVFPAEMRAVLGKSPGRFVDVHNYLVLELPEGEMIVDATWPLVTKSLGFTVNEHFIPGRNHKTAYAPLKTWVVPDDEEPQTFKNRLLQAHFTPEELAFRDRFIRAISMLLT